MREDALRNLSARLGYAIRKATPYLDENDKILLRSPLVDALEDLGLILKAKGKPVDVVHHAPLGLRQEIRLFEALACRDADFAAGPLVIKNTFFEVGDKDQEINMRAHSAPLLMRTVEFKPCTYSIGDSEFDDGPDIDF